MRLVLQPSCAAIVVAAVIALSPAAPRTSEAAVASPSLDGNERLVERDLSGPRVGFTYVPDAPPGYGPFVSQFGWHFEHHVRASGGGPQFLTEVVPLFGGVEFGRIVPSLSIGVGVRLPSGAEFGLGPSFSSGSGTSGGSSALFFAAGRSFDVQGVHVPLNVVLVTNQDGQRVSVLAGYAVRRDTWAYGR